MFDTFKDQLATLEAKSDTFFTTPSWNDKDTPARIGDYICLKPVSYIPPCEDDEGDNYVNLCIVYNSDEVSIYDNSGFHIAFLVGRAEQLYGVYCGTESDFLQTAEAFGFDSHFSSYVKSLGHLRLERLEALSWAPMTSTCLAKHPLRYHNKFADELPHIVSFSQSKYELNGTIITHKHQKWEVVCVEKVSVSGQDTMQECYFLFRTNDDGSRIETINVAVDELNEANFIYPASNSNIMLDGFDLFDEELSSPSSSQGSHTSMKRKRNSDSRVTRTTRKRGEDKGASSSPPFSALPLRVGTFDPRFKEINEAAQSCSSLDDLVDVVLRDETPSPPAEIQSIRNNFEF